MFAITNINMRRVVVFLTFFLLTFTSGAVCAQNATSQEQLRWWYQTTYKLPQLQGLSASILIGYFVTHGDRRVFDPVIRVSNKDLRMDQQGLITFNTSWPWADKLLKFTIVAHLEQDSFVITAHGEGEAPGSETVTRGRLPLTIDELKLSNIIAHSKGPEAQTHNEELGVSDVDLARALIFAAYYYSIPLNLFVALICQETKFDAGSTDRSAIKGIAQLSGAAIDDVENIYFRQPHIIEKIKQNPHMRPNRTYWTHYFHNLLYAAAYLDHLHTSVRNLMPTAADQEVWKFVCVWYNFGMGAGQNAWEQSGRPLTWNKSFSEHLPSGEKRIYSGSIHFYMSKMAEGETHLFQYQPDMVNASQRLNFVRQFNNLLEL